MQTYLSGPLPAIGGDAATPHEEVADAMGGQRDLGRVPTATVRTGFRQATSVAAGACRSGEAPTGGC